MPVGFELQRRITGGRSNFKSGSNVLERGDFDGDGFKNDDGN